MYATSKVKAKISDEKALYRVSDMERARVRMEKGIEGVSERCGKRERVNLGGENGAWPVNVALSLLGEGGKTTPRYRWPRHGDAAVWEACAPTGESRGGRVDLVAHATLFRTGRFVVVARLRRHPNCALLHCFAVVHGMVLDSIHHHLEIPIATIRTHYSDIVAVYAVMLPDEKFPTGFGPYM